MLIEVDGVDVYNEPLDMVVQKVRGPEGTTVKLTIRREGQEDFVLELVRKSINAPLYTRRCLQVEPAISGFITSVPIQRTSSERL